ncbi:hypothetical protein LOTGIDRAFT_139457 [Lottia gigantea]|uniref:Large ribosomal subunit protein mL49 n=1 Tax=Lottia gigantea TaxID=225164 RepID=V4AC96_LOTGI|nr:hypothetical protein LOTGIDRAFT_139457 [Lottia gigantea]ESP01624.1 hypothetical protein LOTGIDRAFT_139457 [Lottia gigantea]
MRVSFDADLISDYEVSTKEMKFVDRLLPKQTVPQVPDNITGITPSGWIPSKESSTSLPYFVRRTKNHMLPVYAEVQHTNRHLVRIKNIDGDIWAFEKDLCEYLENKHNKRPILSQIHEVGRFIRIKGQYIHDVGDFLINKGF